MFASNFDTASQINHATDLFYEEPSLSTRDARFNRLAQQNDASAPQKRNEALHTPDTHFFKGVGAQNFAVIEDKTNKKLGFQLFFREIVNGQEVGELLNLGSAIQFAGALISQATRHDLLHETSLNDLENSKVVPHIINVKFGENTFQFSQVDGSNATQWYEATFLKIMQTIFDKVHTDTVDLLSKKSVFISTVRRIFTGDGLVPNPILGKKPYTFDRAVSLLNLIDSLALGKMLSINQTPTTPKAEATSAADASDYDYQEFIDTSYGSSSQPEHTEQEHPFKFEKFSLETLSQHTTLIENLMKHELNLAGSNWLTRKFHRRRVLKSQKKLEHFKELNYDSARRLHEENTDDFEAITKLHVLCRELKTKYRDMFELRKRFQKHDDWAQNVNGLLRTAGKNVGWQLLSGSIMFQFTKDHAFINALFEGFDIAYQQGYELDEYIVSILSNCMPDYIKNDTDRKKHLAYKSSTLLYKLITNLRGKFAEGEEISGDEQRIVEVIIILSKIFSLSPDGYRNPLGDEALPFQRIHPLLEEDRTIKKFISAFSKERNASYAGRKSEVYKPESRIMPTISSIPGVEN